MQIKMTFAQDFFKEETKSIKVGSDRKRLWAVELDLLAEFDRVCRAHEIKYSIDGGTMLGKVRHNGIIPWDDDIDVIITRKEYEKLRIVAEKEFVYPYFFQTMQSDPNATLGHPVLRNSSTTAILKSELIDGKVAFNNFNHGMFLDIFVLDAIPDNAVERKAFFAELVQLKALIWRAKVAKYLKIRWGFNIRKILRALHMVKEKLLFAWIGMKLGKCPLVFYQDEFEKACRRYENVDTKYVSHILFMPDPPENRIVERAKIQMTEDVEFMGLTVPMLKEWDYYLTLLYGNWRKQVISASQHGECIFDVDRPYTEYLN